MGSLKFNFFLCLIAVTISSTTLSFKAEAKMRCGDYLNSLLYQNINTIFFNNVEVFRQNNNIGPQQRGKLQFNKWVDFTIDFNHKHADSAIGLTPQGKMYHVVNFEGRTIARLLNGEQVFTEFKMLQSGEVVARDANKQTYLYLPRIWETSPRNAVVKRGLVYWGIASAAAIGTKLALIGETMTIPLIEFSSVTIGIPVLETMVVAAAGMNTALVMANRYYHLISYPNGFIPVTLSYSENAKLYSEIRELRQTHPELLDSYKHLEPPDFNRLPPELPKELTEDIQH